MLCFHSFNNLSRQRLHWHFYHSYFLLIYFTHSVCVVCRNKMGVFIQFLFLFYKSQPCWVSTVTVEHVHINGTEDNVHSNAISFLQCSVAGSLERSVVWFVKPEKAVPLRAPTETGYVSVRFPQSIRCLCTPPLTVAFQHYWSIPDCFRHGLCIIFSFYLQKLYPSIFVCMHKRVRVSLHARTCICL